MNTTLKSGILIGLLCGVWTIIMGITGWYIDPVLLNLFFVVILIQIGVLVWGLRQTAPQNLYLRQVIEGTLMSLYGGIILFFFSLVFTTVLFPHYFEDIREMYSQMMRSEGKTEAEIAQAVNEAMASQTPFLQAFYGLTGTVATGLVVSLVIAIVYRKKDVNPVN